MSWACQHCGAPGVEPLYGLETAAVLIPCSARALRAHLDRNRSSYPARYMLIGGAHRKARMLYASELLRIRASMLRGHVDHAPA